MQTESKRKMTSRATIMRELPSSFVLSEADVFCAKGKKAKSHPGNKTLTALIHSHIGEYADANTRLEKSYVVSKIMKHIKSNGGLFVRIVDNTYYDIGGRNAREKVGQALRDLLHDQYRSSTRAKACIRKNRIESSESLVTATLVAKSGVRGALKDKSTNEKPIAVSSNSRLPTLATLMPADTVAADSSHTSKGDVVSNTSSQDTTSKPIAPLSTPEEPLSLSIFDQLNACLEPESDFLLDDIDMDQPLPLAQSLVEDIDFDGVRSVEPTHEKNDTEAGKPVAPTNFVSFPVAPKQQQQQQQQNFQYQVPMAAWFGGGSPTMQNVLMARQFHQNTAPFLCSDGLQSACRRSSESASVFMMKNNNLSSSIVSQTMPIPFGNARMFQ